MRFHELAEDVSSNPAFQKWFDGSKIVDEHGKPLKLYRGLRGYPNLNDVDFSKSRPGYAMFLTTSPHVAASYGNSDELFSISGAIFPVYVKATSLKEFPVKVRDGYRSFDMFDFDLVAKRLRTGEGLVVRQVVDIGPMASTKTDPEKLYSHPSDIYAFGQSTEMKSAIGM